MKNPVFAVTVALIASGLLASTLAHADPCPPNQHLEQRANPAFCHGGQCYASAYYDVCVDHPTAAQQLSDELAKVGVARFTAHDYKPGLVRHVVLFRYGAQVTDGQKLEIRRRFLALRTQAMRAGKPYILSIETGGEISGEGADQGLEQGFIVSFGSQGDRNYYVGQPVVADPAFYDPAHQAFKDFVGPLLHTSVSGSVDGVVVFDFAVGR
jgi:hypothetical protein